MIAKMDLISLAVLTAFWIWMVL